MEDLQDPDPGGKNRQKINTRKVTENNNTTARRQKKSQKYTVTLYKITKKSLT